MNGTASQASSNASNTAVISITECGSLKERQSKLKSHSCEKCNFKSATKQSLSKHNREVHLKQKDFDCDKCEYRASKQTALERHVNAVHLKIKDFQCPDCDYKAAQRREINTHVNSVHFKLRLVFARWSRPTPILIVFLNQAGPVSSLEKH
jgi:uncharacterized Zn-finger protein